MTKGALEIPSKRFDNGVCSTVGNKKYHYWLIIELYTIHFCVKKITSQLLVT